MITIKALSGMAVGFAGMVIIGGAYYGIIYFLNKAAEYEARAKHYFDDK